MALSLTTAPTVAPVTAAEVTDHLQLDDANSDDYITNFVIPAARAYAETFTRRAFLSQTYTLTLLSFPCGPIILPRPPLISVTSVAYIDTAGDSQTWAASKYTVTTPSGDHALHGSIEPVYGEVYPSTRGVADAVTVTFVAGFGTTASDVPTGLKQANLMLCADLYTARESAATGTIVSAHRVTAEALLSPYVAEHYALRFD